MNESQNPQHQESQDPTITAAVLRERPEPRESDAPVPLWLVILIALVVFWGGMYLSFYSGGFQSDVYNPGQVSWSGGGSGATAAPPDPKVVGKRIFSQNCAVCHQSTGLGVPGSFPPLAGSEWVLAQEWHGDNHLVKIVLTGLQGPVTVKGQQFNGAMVPWAKVLKDDQIAAVLTYIRSEWGNDAPPITADYVKSIRAKTDRSEQWTQKDLQAIGKELISEGEKTPAPAEAPAKEPAAPAAPGA